MSTNRIVKALLGQLRLRCSSHQDLRQDCTCPGDTPVSLKPSQLGRWEAATSRRDAPCAGWAYLWHRPEPARTTPRSCRRAAWTPSPCCPWRTPGRKCTAARPPFQSQCGHAGWCGGRMAGPRRACLKRKKKWDCRDLAIGFKCSANSGAKRVTPRTNLHTSTELIHLVWFMPLSSFITVFSCNWEGIYWAITVMWCDNCDVTMCNSDASRGPLFPTSQPRMSSYSCLLCLLLRRLTKAWVGWDQKAKAWTQSFFLIAEKLVKLFGTLLSTTL